MVNRTRRSVAVLRTILKVALEKYQRVFCSLEIYERLANEISWMIENTCENYTFFSWGCFFWPPVGDNFLSTHVYQLCHFMFRNGHFKSRFLAPHTRKTVQFGHYSVESV